MTRERAKELLPVITAYADGKEIEYKGAGGDVWTAKVECAWRDNCDYRIVTTKKLRPWTFEEVPVGAIVKLKHKGDRAIIAFAGGDLVRIGSGVAHGVSSLLEHYTHSTDGGKTWLPCGVEGEAP